MRILHVVPTIRRTDGGIGPAAVELAERLAEAGVETWLLTAGRDLPPDQLFMPTFPRLHIVLARTANTYGWHAWRDGSFVQAVDGFDWRDTVVHVHGLWIKPVCDVQRLGVAHGCPVVLSPHGMFNPWALRRRAWKKVLAWTMFQSQAFHSLALLVGTSSQESQVPHWLRPSLRSAVIPFGMPSAPLPVQRAKHAFTVLFMGRLHPVKGLDNLIKAWARVAKPGWRLRIAGPDPEGYSRVLRTLLAQLDCQSSVEILGPVYGEAKRELLNSCSLFVLPSHSENFSLVVAEALQAGLPVVASNNSPWPMLVEERCGWWIPVDIDTIARTLREAMSLPHAELQEMGQRGARLIKRQFEWRHVIGRYISVYESLIKPTKMV